MTTDGRTPTTTDFDHASRSYGSDEHLVLGTDRIADATFGILVAAYAGGGDYELRIRAA